MPGKKTVNMHSLSSSRFQNNPNNNSLNANQHISINSKLNTNQKNYLTNADRRPMLSAIQKPRYAGAQRYEDENFNGSQSGSNLLLSSQSDKKFVNSERLSLERRSYDHVRAEKGGNNEGFSTTNDAKAQSRSFAQFIPPQSNVTGSDLTGQQQKLAVSQQRSHVLQKGSKSLQAKTIGTMHQRMAIKSANLNDPNPKAQTYISSQ